jgi:hypothetical protein
MLHRKRISDQCYDVVIMKKLRYGNDYNAVMVNRAVLQIAVFFIPWRRGAKGRMTLFPSSSLLRMEFLIFDGVLLQIDCIPFRKETASDK